MMLIFTRMETMIAEHNCDDLTQVNNDGNNERMIDYKSDNNYMTGDLVSQQAMRELS